MFRLDRAILREVLPLALICLLGLTFLFTTVGLFQIVNRFEVTPRVTTLLAFWPVLWKSLLPMTLPISLTFATAMVYGRMRAEGELLVLSSAGVSPWRQFALLVPLGLICGALSFYAASEMGPDAYARRFALSRQALADFVNHPPGGARELRLTGLDISYADAREGQLHELTLVLHHDDGPSSTACWPRSPPRVRAFAMTPTSASWCWSMCASRAWFALTPSPARPERRT